MATPESRLDLAAHVSGSAVGTARVDVAVGDTMDYLQVELTVDLDQGDEAADALATLGALSVTVESASDEAAFDVALPGEPRWVRQKLVGLFAPESDRDDLAAAISTALPGEEPVFSVLADRDWERAWLDQFSPIRIADGLWIVPSWIDPPEPGAVNLVIDPGLAFGTGTHPTTRLCLEALTQLDLADKRVLDYGCGSGVLAIAALRLGAAEAIATDLDPRALDATRANAEENRCGDRLLTMDPDSVDRRYAGGVDVLIANILAGTLVELQDRLLALLKPGGVVLLSGILADQADAVRRCYGAHCVLERRDLDDWVLLSGIHSREGLPA